MNPQDIIFMDREHLDALYVKYNQREFVSPDPLQFLYDYPDVREREVAALIASSLAFGRVAQIVRSVGIVLQRLGPSPRAFLKAAAPESIRTMFGDFIHRFVTGADLAEMLLAVKRVIRRYGSLYACFLSGVNADDETVLPALAAFVRELSAETDGRRNYLLPAPERGSACKRLNLFLRWMVRKDDVDPGGWHGISPSMLIIPLDVHMHRICRAFGLTARKGADMRTAVEITDAFREIAPEDPARYDFCLTRPGIRDDIDPGEILKQYGMCFYS